MRDDNVRRRAGVLAFTIKAFFSNTERKLGWATGGGLLPEVRLMLEPNSLEGRFRAAGPLRKRRNPTSWDVLYSEPGEAGNRAAINYKGRAQESSGGATTAENAFIAMPVDQGVLPFFIQWFAGMHVGLLLNLFPLRWWNDH